jgi:hypothetical protein
MTRITVIIRSLITDVLGLVNRELHPPETVPNRTGAEPRPRLVSLYKGR